MPEDPIINEGQNQITYNVVLDPGDISRQAEEIRNQLDLALGVGSGAGTQFINTTDVINPQFTPMPMGDMSSMSGQFGGTMDQSFWQKAQASLGEAYQNMSQGVDMVRNDLSRMVDRTSNVIQQYQPEPQPVNPYEDLIPDSFGEYLVGSLGFGGDIKGPVSIGKYGDYSDRKLREGFEDILKNPGEALSSVTDAWAGSGVLGTASYIGAHFIPGIGAALSIAEGVGIADEWVSGAYNKREDLAGGVQEIARQTFGTISKEEARGMSQGVLDFVNSYEGYAKEYDIEEVSKNITQFANEGGFSNVQSGEELQSKMQTVTEQTRQIARNLGVFQEEAVSIMAELEQKSMVNVESMRDMSEKMKFYSGVLRESPTELLQGAVNTAEQFRQAGSFVSPETAMQTYIDANMEATNLIRSSDPYVQSSVYRMGGKEGVTQGLISSYGQLQNSTMGGFINMSNAAGGSGGFIGDVIGNVGGAYQDLNSITNYFARGKEDATKNQSFQEVSLNFMELATSLYQQLAPNEKPTLENLEGLIMLPGMNQMFGNLSQDQVRLMIESVRNDMVAIQNGVDPNKRIQSGKIVSALDSAVENTETTKLGELAANTVRYVDNMGRDISYAYGEIKGDVAEDVMDLVYGTNKIDAQGNRIGNGAMRNPGVFEYIGDYLESGGGLSGMLYAGRKRYDNEADYEVTAEFTNKFTRDQVSAGRNSNIGKLVDDNVRGKMETEAMELLRKRGIKITDTKDLNKEENQKILKDANLDESSIKTTLDSMWGVDSSLTEDQKFAMDMWDKTPVTAHREEQYYTSAIEDLIKDNPNLFKDKSLEEIMGIIDTKVKSPNDQMPEEIKEQVKWQAMDNIKDKNFQEKMISKKEAEWTGSKTWSKISGGAKLRNETLDKLSLDISDMVSQETRSLINSITNDKDIEILPPQLKESYNEAFKTALAEVTSGEFQGTPEEMQNRIMGRTEELYNTAYGTSHGRTFKGMNLDDNLREKLFDQNTPSGQIFSNLTRNQSNYNTIKPIKEIYNVVDEKIKSIQQSKGSEQLNLNVDELTSAFYEMIPGMAAAGAPIKIQDLSEASVKEMDKLLSAIKKDGANSTEVTTQIQNLMSTLDLSGGDKDKVQKEFEKWSGKESVDLDTKEMGPNTKKIKDNTTEMKDLLRFQLAGKDLDDYRAWQKTGNKGG